jgi:crotonobetainyl-CoA:carnitine CoA-transferase CaiB-like acyl-CoA transferase
VEGRPLADLRVLDLSRLLPGPFLTMVLADLGADVVKLEDPALGDYVRQLPPLRGGVGARYLAVNRGKRSLALDLKSAAGRDALLRMAERADVVVESFRPGVLDRLGVGAAALTARNPRLVVCSLSGFGQDGPHVARAGHDLGYLALAGVLAMGGEPGGPPALPGVQLADLGGALWGATGILAALHGRAKHGRGAHLDISMTEGALALLAAELGAAAAGASPPPSRGVTPLTGGLACYAIYRCQDDRYLAVAALEPRFWLAFNAAIGRAADALEVAAPPARQAAIRAEVAAILVGRTRDAWVAALAGVDACAEPVLELDELAGHPQHAARGVFFAIDDALGELPQLRTPLGRPAAPRPPPALGEGGAAVLAEYGFAPAEIAALLGYRQPQLR